MEPRDRSLRDITRRHFFKDVGFGIGSLALAALMRERLFAFTPEADAVLSQAARAVAPRLAAKAKQVIYLFMAGAPSHPGRRAFRIRQGHTALAGVAVQFRAPRAVGGGDLRAAAPPRRAR